MRSKSFSWHSSFGGDGSAWFLSMAGARLWPKRKMAVLQMLVVIFLAGAAPSLANERDLAQAWTAEEKRILHMLSLDSLKPLPPDPSNHVADNPKAALFGERLFFDPRFSDNGEVACANCHRPERYFTDGRPLAQGLGETKRGAPSLIGAAYYPWLYWDGRRDSQWSQALVPLETAEEHGFDRRRVLQVIKDDEELLSAYLELFERMPEGDDAEEINHAFANVGKAIAAYERTLLPSPSRFDAYVNAVLNPTEPSAVSLNETEVAGLRLFISHKTQCLRCHNGPLFTNFAFHNIGIIEGKRGQRTYDFGRAQGVGEALADPFRCGGAYSDAEPDQCIEESFVRIKGRELVAAFKVPTLRNIAMTAPYMHDGRFPELREVLDHYNDPPLRPIGFQQLSPLNLTPKELQHLEAFLSTLTGSQPVAR